MYITSSPNAQAQAYTGTPGVITGLDDSGPPGRAKYDLRATTAAWWAQGIASIAFTATAATDTLTTATPHKLITGMPIQVSTSSALPGGLLAATTYWAIYVDALNFKLATTRANAMAGTQIDITSAGTGTQTAATVAVAGAAGSALINPGEVVRLDGSNGSTVSVVQDGTGGKASIAPAGNA